MAGRALDSDDLDRPARREKSSAISTRSEPERSVIQRRALSVRARSRHVITTRIPASEAQRRCAARSRNSPPLQGQGRDGVTQTGYPHGRPGYVVDHIIPLKRGGADEPWNMQWQTIAAGKAKDATE